MNMIHSSDAAGRPDDAGRGPCGWVWRQEAGSVPSKESLVCHILHKSTKHSASGKKMTQVAPSLVLSRHCRHFSSHKRANQLHRVCRSHSHSDRLKLLRTTPRKTQNRPEMIQSGLACSCLLLSGFASVSLALVYGPRQDISGERRSASVHVACRLSEDDGQLCWAATQLG